MKLTGGRHHDESHYAKVVAGQLRLDYLDKVRSGGVRSRQMMPPGAMMRDALKRAGLSTLSSNRMLMNWA